MRKIRTRRSASAPTFSVERAGAILKFAGQTADSHTGLTEAIETVLWVARRKWLPPER